MRGLRQQQSFPPHQSLRDSFSTPQAGGEAGEHVQPSLGGRGTAAARLWWMREASDKLKLPDPESDVTSSVAFGATFPGQGEGRKLWRARPKAFFHPASGGRSRGARSVPPHRYPLTIPSSVSLTVLVATSEMNFLSCETAMMHPPKSRRIFLITGFDSGLKLRVGSSRSSTL